MQATRSALVFWPNEVNPISLNNSENNNNNNNSELRHFLIGWNVRDFTIVVAAIVSSNSVDTVRKLIHQLHEPVRKLSFQEHEKNTAPVLTIVGLYLPLFSSSSSLNSSSSSRLKTSPTTPTTDGNNNSNNNTTIQELRNSTHAYIELEEVSSSSSTQKKLPAMRSLYTSGIKFDATLHLLCYNPKQFDTRKVPLPFSPLVRLSPEEVESILAGKPASRVLRGGQSILEGPFLPPHALNLMPPLHPRHLAPRSFFMLNQHQQQQGISNLSFASQGVVGSFGTNPLLSSVGGKSSTSFSATATPATTPQLRATRHQQQQNILTMSPTSGMKPQVSGTSSNIHSNSPAPVPPPNLLDNKNQQQNFLPPSTISQNNNNQNNNQNQSTATTSAERSTSSTSSHHQNNNNTSNANKVMTSPSKAKTTGDNNNTFDQLLLEEEDDVVEVDVKSLNPKIPPRLRFPTAAGLTDLACCQTCLSGVAFLQEKLDSASSSKNNININLTEKIRENSLFENILISVSTFIFPFVVIFLKIITYLAKISYTAAILEYKLRELINVLALITGKTTTCGLHPVLPHTLCGVKGERKTCLMAFASRQIIGDVLFGFLLSWMLVEGGQHLQNTIFEFMRKFAWYGLHGMHVGYFDWFHGYPAGFKMNADLNEVLCFVCLKAMEFFSVAVAFVSSYIDIYATAYKFLIFVTFGGASLGLSFVADCCNLSTLHLRILYHSIAYLYHGLTTISSSLFLLMRGKKRNLLKNRVDEATFEFDEVVLGTMACTVFAFLIPTVALYYFYLACTRTIIWVLQESVRGVAVLCCNAPIYPTLLWLSRRKQWMLTGGVVVTNIRSRCVRHGSEEEGENSAETTATHSSSSSVEKNLGEKSSSTGNKANDEKQSGGNKNNNNNNKSEEQKKKKRNSGDTSQNNNINDDNNNNDGEENNNNNSDGGEYDVVADVAFLSLPFLAIFKELKLLINLLFAGTFSPSRMFKFIWLADANSKPIIDVPNKIFRHLTADPAQPSLSS